MPGGNHAEKIEIVVDSPSCEELAIHRIREGSCYTCLTLPDYRENSVAKIKKAAAVSADHLQYEQHAVRVF